MPIEVRELVIKAVVVSDSDDSLRDTSDNLAGDIGPAGGGFSMREVVAKVIEILNDRNVR